MSSSEQLTPRQRRAIEALLTARNVTDAAQAAGISRRTLTGWLTLSTFQAALKQAQGEVIGATVRRLADVTGLAVDTLQNVMGSSNAEDRDKVRAANIALSRLPELLQIHDFEERLARLEAAAQGAKDDKSK